MAFFVTCSVWVRMMKRPPRTIDLVRLVLRGFPEVIDAKPIDFLCQEAPKEQVDELAVRLSRATRAIASFYRRYAYKVDRWSTSEERFTGSYKVIPPVWAKFNDPKLASELIAGIWYATHDVPAHEIDFTEHVQSLFPALDQLEVAKACSWVCRDMMPEVYMAWPRTKKREVVKKKAVCLRRMRERGPNHG